MTAPDLAGCAPARVALGVGLLGALLLAASVLPLATTYAVCEAFGWERGIDHRPGDAPMFYGLYTTLIGLSSLSVLIAGLRLFRLMWLSQIANAVLLPGILVVMLRLANNAQIMQKWRNRRVSNVLVIVLTVLVVLATGSLLASP